LVRCRARPGPARPGADQNVNYDSQVAVRARDTGPWKGGSGPTTMALRTTAPSGLPRWPSAPPRLS